MSTHKVEVVRVGPVEKHPNADSLGIVQVWGYTAIVRLGDIVEGDLAIYVEPDYVLPAVGEHPEAEHFAFLRDRRRVKAMRLRGTWSQGLLVKAWGDMQEGDDVMEKLGITHYEPSMGKINTDGNTESACASLATLPKYDIESLRRNFKFFVPGEEVIATEKIHGANAKFTWRDGRMRCGSRTQWKMPPGVVTREDGTTYEVPETIWWSAVRQNPWIAEWCEANPDLILFGEVFGQVQDLKYGAKPGQIFFRAFDIMTSDWQWMDAPKFMSMLDEEHRVPVVYSGPFDFAVLEELSRGDSKLAKHLSEGLVIKPVVERRERSVGRIAFKLVSDRYLERS